MKLKTSELEGAALDWAVAKCEFERLEQNGCPVAPWIAQLHAEGDLDAYPSTDWAQGGPIIEREKIALYLNGDDGWTGEDGWKRATGPTPLIAAMRCYVASKLGEEVEVPDGLN